MGTSTLSLPATLSEDIARQSAQHYLGQSVDALSLGEDQLVLVGFDEVRALGGARGWADMLTRVSQPISHGGTMERCARRVHSLWVVALHYQD
jgi:hypothetical protein